MAYRIEPDILMIDEFNRPVAVVETKLDYDLAEGWAQDLSCKYANAMNAPYALVITPDWINLWRSGKASGTADSEWTIPSRSILSSHFEELGFDPESVSIQGFEGLVALWLQDLSDLARKGEGLPSLLDIFEASGLAKELATASIERGVRFETVR
jgi:hypothetical protein